MLTTIQSMVVNVDSKMSEMKTDMKEMKNEILDMQKEIKGMKDDISDIKERAECYKVDIINKMDDKLKTFEKFADIKNEAANEFQKSLVSAIEDIGRNLPHKDDILNKKELTESLDELYSMSFTLIDRSEFPHENNENELKQLLDVVQQLPKKGEIMLKNQLEVKFKDIKGAINKKENQEATEG